MKPTYTDGISLTTVPTAAAAQHWLNRDATVIKAARVASRDSLRQVCWELQVMILCGLECVVVQIGDLLIKKLNRIHVSCT